jgi:isoquinoline 1-oxidoreductase beta subunit
MQISMLQSRTFAVAAHSKKCVPQSMLQPRREEKIMNLPVPNLSRRNFIVGSSAVTAGLAIGLDLPSMISTANATTASNASASEIGVWVVVQPNDTVVIRVVRSEMGQGTITGLAQLVAEELECNWSKVTVDYPTPGESLKRKGVWGHRKITSAKAALQRASC